MKRLNRPIDMSIISQVILAGLDMDYNGIPFENSIKLMGISDHVIKLKAVCVHCGADASMTHKLIDNQSRVEIGGNESYSALCRPCWNIARSNHV